MFCPYCASEKTEVQGTIKGMINRRFRHCKQCGATWKTVEVLTESDEYSRDYIRQLLEAEFDTKKSSKERAVRGLFDFDTEDDE